MKRYKVKIISEELKKSFSIEVLAKNKTHAKYFAGDYVLESIKPSLMYKVKKQ